MVPVLLIAAACGGEDAAVAESAPAAAVAAEPTPPASEGASIAPAEGGQVIEVTMTMTNGGAFEPSEITARQGDVIRFVNADNVHNVSFPTAKNPGASGLPAPSPFLTSPGQTYELSVEMGPGTYTFQCDPHVAMGMTGTLTVQ